MERKVSADARCAQHADRPATGTCKRCGRFICDACSNRLGVCAQCLARALPAAKSPRGWVDAILVALIFDNTCGLIGLAAGALVPKPADPTQVAVIIVGALADLGGFLMLAVVPAIFLRWLLLATRRAAALGANLTETPAWMVAWWLIPLANFVQGFRLLRRLGLALTGRDQIGPLVWPWAIAFAASFALAWGVPWLISGATPMWLHVAVAVLWMFSSLCLYLVMRRFQRALDAAEFALAAP